MKEEKRILGLILALVVTATVPLTLGGLSQRQETRKKAFERPPSPSERVSVSISPSGGTLQPGSFLTALVNLTNTGQASIQLNTAGVDLGFDTSLLEISQVACNINEFPLIVKNQADIQAGKIFLTCSKQGGKTPLTINPGQSAKLGSFQIAAKQRAVSGTTTVNFTRSVVPNAATAQEPEKQLLPATYILASIPRPTPTPTPTPCSPPPIPALDSPLPGQSFPTSGAGLSSYVDLKVIPLEQKCGPNSAQYWFTFFYTGAGESGKTYQSGWTTNIWHTGPYFRSGTATWKAKARYYDNYYRVYRESDWSQTRNYSLYRR